jgi:hypothetical protein
MTIAIGTENLNAATICIYFTPNRTRNFIIKTWPSAT